MISFHTHRGGNPQTHGKARTNADKRRAVDALLADAEWRKNSANWIAKTAAVSVQFVCNIKNSLSTVESGPVKTSDGRTMNTANIGGSRTLAHEIGEAVGVSGSLVDRAKMNLTV